MPAEDTTKPNSFLNPRELPGPDVGKRLDCIFPSVVLCLLFEEMASANPKLLINLWFFGFNMPLLDFPSMASRIYFLALDRVLYL
jgi:hypothetical protein